MPKRTRPYHDFILEQLTDPVFASEYLNEARKDSKKVFLKALRNVAEARRIAVVAAEAGVNRESLYRTLSGEGNPRLETYNSVLSALGIDYVFQPKGASAGSDLPTVPANTAIAAMQTQKAGSFRITASATLFNRGAATWTTPYIGNLAASSTKGSEPYGTQLSDDQSTPRGLVAAQALEISERQEAGQG